MDLNCENVFKLVVYGMAAYVTLRIIQDNCDIGLGSFFKNVEGFATGKGPIGPLGHQGPQAQHSVSGGIAAAEQVHNAGPQMVQGLGRTPSTCYPQPALKAEDLLPKEDSEAIKEFNIAKPAGVGILQGVNMLDAGFHIGVNSIGQSLRNANRQLRSEPPNPQVQVSPWQMSSIGPDLMRRPLEDGEGCSADQGQGNLWKPGSSASTTEPVGA
tara:strand:- start:127 stop:765 length:639 start_codon:yes stop_codon:yes gene_type:complete